VSALSEDNGFLVVDYPGSRPERKHQILRSQPNGVKPGVLVVSDEGTAYRTGWMKMSGGGQSVSVAWPEH
jgi:hypothetical protein